MVTIFKHFRNAKIPCLAGQNACNGNDFQAFPTNPVFVDAAQNMLDFAEVYKHIYNFA